MHQGAEASKKAYYMWMEGPSEINLIPYASTTKDNENIEPFAHMSLALYSDEMGIYRSYSFGVGSFGVQSKFHTFLQDPYMKKRSLEAKLFLGH